MTFMIPEQDTKYIADLFRALGDPTRLRIFEFIRSCSCEVALDDQGSVRPVFGRNESGPTVGEVCCCITGVLRANSGVSFHLKTLREAGLIVMERRGKHFICSIAPGAVQRLGAFLRATACTFDRL